MERFVELLIYTFYLGFISFGSIYALYLHIQQKRDNLKVSTGISLPILSKSALDNISCTKDFITTMPASDGKIAAMTYDKEKVKEMFCKAIDNIPDCAAITDCYTEHGFMESKAYIKIQIKVKDESDENILIFHNMAHNGFESGMDYIS